VLTPGSFLQQYISRSANPEDTLELTEVTRANAVRMADNLSRMPLGVSIRSRSNKGYVIDIFGSFS